MHHVAGKASVWGQELCHQSGTALGMPGLLCYILRPPVNLHLPAKQHWTQTKPIQFEVFLESPPHECNVCRNISATHCLTSTVLSDCHRTGESGSLSSKAFSQGQHIDVQSCVGCLGVQQHQLRWSFMQQSGSAMVFRPSRMFNAAPIDARRVHAQGL